MSFGLYSQDTMELKKRNFFVFNNDYLYNQYIGHRHFEITSGPSSSRYDTSYYHTTAENTSGFIVSTEYRHFLDNHFLIQMGINFRNTTASFLHHDSVVNENNSPIIRSKRIYNSIATPAYFGFQLKRFTFLTGMILPIVTFSYSKNNFEDGSVSKSNVNSSNSIWTDFYLSEKIHFNLLKKQNNVGISIGVDLDPEIFNRYRRGYLINWNAGIVWVIEKKKKAKPEDCVN